ncbi:MAG: 1,4-dihydroxy-2-naphthoate octaprenyltransferase [Verrucomicrobiota bacterium]|jgi:1,4-dihydroxy-2-naphthoate octaprenyltransferase
MPLSRKARTFLLASRPKTLPAAIAPVAAGCALAWKIHHAFNLTLALCTLLSTLAIQIATNYFNDAVDAGKGADTSQRLGPRRATATGLVSPRAMLTAGAAALLAAIAFSLPLVAARGWPILAIGMLALYFSYGYTGGPAPLAYLGLGELFVILFFGLIAVSGTVFVQTGSWSPHSLIAGFQAGLLSTALIAINNLRDRREDQQSGKRTLAVRTGPAAARAMITTWCLLPFALGFLWLLYPQTHRLAWWPLPAAALGCFVSWKIIRTEPSRTYNRYLALAALQLILWTTLFCAACLAP